MAQAPIAAGGLEEMRIRCHSTAELVGMVGAWSAGKGDMLAGLKRGNRLWWSMALVVALMACEDDTIGDRDDPLGSGGMGETAGDSGDGTDAGAGEEG